MMTIGVKNLYWKILGISVLLIGLYFLSEYNYSAFHITVEMFSIIVAYGLFMIFWNSREFNQYAYFLLLGIAFLFIGSIDLLHTMAYKGMNVFSQYDSNLTLQLWIAARYLQSITLLIAPFFMGKKIKISIVFIIYGIVSSLLVWTAFAHIFPLCYVEGSGLTTFKIFNEYIISIILIASLFVMYNKRDYFHRNIFRMLMLSIIFTIISEIAFTFYVSLYGISNFVGHIFKILSFYLIYKALIERGLKMPYSTLFKEYRKSENAARNKLKAIMEPTGSLDSLGLSDIIDTEALQSMMDKFFKITNIGGAICDTSGKLLVSVGWQDICSKFHRINPGTLQNCHESDTILSTGVEPGTFKAYRCKNNMWDLATPIEVGGRIVGNIYIGQFFYDDETPNVDLFRNQARLYGFDEKEYLAALKKVPRFNKEKVEATMLFYSKLAGIISNLSYSSIRLARSINELKQAKKTITESEKKFRGYIDNSPDGVFVSDNNGNYIEVNHSAEIITGYSQSELLNKNIRDLLPPESEQEGLEHFDTLKKTGQAHGELLFRRKDGVIRWWSVDAVRLSNDRFLALTKDITSRKQTEKELVAAKELAEEGNRLKLAFLQNMAHEIRTPMNAVIGFADLLPEVEGDEKNEYAMIIQKGAGQLLELIDDVILMSRLQSGSVHIEINEFSPAELVKDVYQMFNLPDLNKGLSITVNIPKEHKDLIICSDACKIKQVLANFVSNAVKYTMNGSVELGFLSRNGEIEFYVTDTGMGIPADEQNQIFDSFYRGKQAVASAIRGTGLGLSIAKELIESLGGKIGMSSEVNQGARFYFTIQIEKSARANATRLESQVPQQAWPDDFAILVVEDDPTNFRYIEIVLKNKFKRIDNAMNGQEAVDMASQNHYDLVLMDLKMPVMDGYEATRQIKQKFPDLPIIAQTAHVRPEEEKLALKAGCDDYIAKPFKKADLLEKINQRISKRK